MWKYNHKGRGRSTKMRKNYGKYQELTCAFCEDRAVHYNKQRVPTCRNHQKETLVIEICVICSGIAELREGKFGIYVGCEKCGNINLRKFLSASH